MSRQNSNFSYIKEDNKSLQAALSLLRQDFDAHNHDGTSSKTFQTLLAETLSARALSIRKTSYSDNSAGLWSGVVGGLAKFFLGNATDNFKFNGTSLNIALASGGINIDGGSLTITQSIGNLLLNSSGMLFKVTTYDNANILLSSGSGPVGNGVQLRFCVGGSSGGSGGQIDFTYTAANTANFSPSSGKSINLGTSTYRYQYIYLVNNPDVSSDERLKTDIEDVPYGLSTVMAMRPIRYKMFGNTALGFSAQDINKLIPEITTNADKEEKVGDPKPAVKYDKKGEIIPEPTASMRPNEIIPVLVKAIQELSTKVTTLENKIKV